MQGIAKNISRKAYYSSPPFIQRAVRYLTPGQRQFRKYLRELEESQWWPPQQLEELQNEKLRRIIHHAYENVPYYRRVFDERGLKPKDLQSKEDLRKLPLLDKYDIRFHYDELKATNLGKWTPTLSHTSGSTGIPLKFLLDKNNLVLEGAFVMRAWSWGGFSEKGKQAVLRGVVTGSNEFYKIDKGSNALILSSFLLNHQTVGRYVEKINEFSPQLIRGYPSTLHYFCKLLQEKGLNCVKPIMAQTSSETLLDFQREIIEGQLGCKVFDLYGNGEHVSVISECKEGNYHINSEYGITEFINQVEEETKVGELAEMVCTGLNNFSMPLIRYRVGDMASFSGRRCPCGRGLPIVDSLEGRLDDMIITPDGRRISAAGMTLAFEFSENIKQCQLVQDTGDELVVNIAKNERYGEEDHNFVINQLRKRIGAEMKIRVNFVENIPRTKEGKYRFMISNLPGISAT